METGWGVSRALNSVARKREAEFWIPALPPSDNVLLLIGWFWLLARTDRMFGVELLYVYQRITARPSSTPSKGGMVISHSLRKPVGLTPHQGYSPWAAETWRMEGAACIVDGSGGPRVHQEWRHRREGRAQDGGGPRRSLQVWARISFSSPFSLL